IPPTAAAVMVISNNIRFESNTIMFTETITSKLLYSLGEIVVGDLFSRFMDKKLEKNLSKTIKVIITEFLKDIPKHDQPFFKEALEAFQHGSSQTNLSQHPSIKKVHDIIKGKGCPSKKEWKEVFVVRWNEITTLPEIVAAIPGFCAQEEKIDELFEDLASEFFTAYAADNEHGHSEILKKLENIEELVAGGINKPPEPVNKGAIPITETRALSAAPHFIGREQNLADIKSLIAENRKMVLLSGLGGIGKTEICRKLYAQCVAGEVPTVKYVGWIGYHNNLKASFHGKFRDVALGDGNIDEYYRNVWSYLDKIGDALLLFIDNVNNEDASEIEYLDTLSCNVLLTSRIKIKRMEKMNIDEMPPDICRKLYRTHSEDERSPDELLDAIIELAACHTLAVELLAKTQLASGKTAEQLLADLKKSGFALSEIKETVDYAHKEKRFIDQMAIVFDIAGVGRSKADREELRVLRLMSLLAFEPVDKTTLKDWFAIESLNAVNRLVKKGWLIQTTETETPSILMHPVIADVVKYKKKPDIKIAEPLVTALTVKLRMEATDVFTEKLPYLPHALSVAKCFDEITDSKELARLFHNMASIYDDLGDYAEAMEWNEKARVIREKVLGKEHADTAATYNNIAGVYDSQGDYAKALKWFEKALAVYEKVLGMEHPDTAMTCNNIAAVYRVQGIYAEALKWFEKARDICEKVPDNEYLDTSATYNNMALLYKNQGDYARAMELYEKALAIREKVLGKEHPLTAQMYNNIALVYKDQGDYAKALELYEKALAIREKVLGKEHPDTATTYNNIAGVYVNQGYYAKALEWYEKSLPIIEKKLGKEHPNIAGTYNNIAVVYKNQGNYAQALEWFQKALTIYEKVLGKEHPLTAVTYNNIALVHGNQGDFTTALEGYEKALRIDHKVLGPNHPHFLQFRDNAEKAHKQSGRTESFETWLEETLRGEE
ncbi:MAG: tetratricopeptide repeat protein, partial [Planctomycetaceae bacterium]|nr:tetratricopeptide repeat protein [Planctomycetaceae bacterium]